MLMLTSELDPHVQNPQAQPRGVRDAVGPSCAVPVHFHIVGTTDLCLGTLW